MSLHILDTHKQIQNKRNETHIDKGVNHTHTQKLKSDQTFFNCLVWYRLSLFTQWKTPLFLHSLEIRKDLISQSLCPRLIIKTYESILTDKLTVINRTDFWNTADHVLFKCHKYQKKKNPVKFPLDRMVTVENFIP